LRFDRHYSFDYINWGGVILRGFVPERSCAWRQNVRGNELSAARWILRKLRMTHFIKGALFLPIRAFNQPGSSFSTHEASANPE
jgi:hypothetical protein